MEFLKEKVSKKVLRDVDVDYDVFIHRDHVNGYERRKIMVILQGKLI